MSRDRDGSGLKREAICVFVAQDAPPEIEAAKPARQQERKKNHEHKKNLIALPRRISRHVQDPLVDIYHGLREQDQKTGYQNASRHGLPHMVSGNQESKPPTLEGAKVNYDVNAAFRISALKRAEWQRLFRVYLRTTAAVAIGARRPVGLF